MKLTRRAFLASSSALALSQAVSAAGLTQTVEPVPFSAQTVEDLARNMAGHGFEPRKQVPQPWRDLTYDQYRQIRFRPEAALWRGTPTPYSVDFFTPGLYFPRTIRVDTVEDGEASPVRFNMSMFTRTSLVPDLPVDETLGFSGLRLRTEMHRLGKQDEFCVFQGASYFRAIGLGYVYGLSARGLALKTADPEGEEFPEFTRFWLERPKPGQRNMIVHALMDSPSVTGAYRFDILPGPNCVMEVEAKLFPRTELGHVGLAPLTSMFLFDDTNRSRFDDFRPAVHDNDGLLMRNGAGEALWRPLANPKRLQVSSFVDDGPVGFGLQQRARKYSDFSDLEALYHRRPGLWVEPRGDWGKGAVTLVEIPTDQEIYDNIVAYWRPRDPVPAGERLDLAYRLTWGDDADASAGVARVLNTAMGARRSGGRIATVDFEDHPDLAGDPSNLTIHVSSPHAETSEGILQRNPDTGGVRLAFSFDPGEAQLAELRAQLLKQGRPVTEVWMYRWTA